MSDINFRGINVNARSRTPGVTDDGILLRYKKDAQSAGNDKATSPLSRRSGR